MVIATDKQHAHAGGEIERKVALKFMKNSDQFARERESREFFKNLDNYVIGIYDAYNETDHKSYRDALAKSYVSPFASSIFDFISLLSSRLHACSNLNRILLCSQIFSGLQGLPLPYCHAAC